jgi:hypothetical protein
MSDSIREDVHCEIETFIARLRSTLDPGAYPKLGDAARFEVRMEVLDAEFLQLRRLFHDYLTLSWAEEFKRSAAGMGRR